jgi:hypothetical protein
VAGEEKIRTCRLESAVGTSHTFALLQYCALYFPTSIDHQPGTTFSSSLRSIQMAPAKMLITITNTIVKTSTIQDDDDKPLSSLSIHTSLQPSTSTLTGGLNLITFSDPPQDTIVTSIVPPSSPRTISPPTTTFSEPYPFLPSFVTFTPTSSMAAETGQSSGLTLEPTVVASLVFSTLNSDVAVWMGVVMCLLMVVHAWRLW